MSISRANTPPRRDPITRSGRIAVEDPYLHEVLLPPWDLVLSPMQRGPYGYRMQYLATPHFAFYRGTFDSAVRFRGLSPPNTLVVLVSDPASSRGTLWNRPYPDAGVPCSVPGAAEATFEAGDSHLVVLVQLDMLRGRYAEGGPVDWERWGRARLAPAPRASVARLGAWLQTALDKSTQQPQMLEDGYLVHSLGEELLDNLTSMTESESELVSPVPTGAVRRRAVGAAIEYARSLGDAVPSVPELCRAARVSQRTLEYAFREAFDLTPHAFLRLQRLHAARRRLVLARSIDTTVTETAFNCGFWHLARFASAYRSLFGELPSETLARGRPMIDSPLFVAPASKFEVSDVAGGMGRS